MKKTILGLILLMSVAFSISSCSKKDEKKIWQLGKKVRPLSNFSEKKRSGEKSLIARRKQQELIDILKLANRAKALDF